jgi:hypothetical protein
MSAWAGEVWVGEVWAGEALAGEAWDAPPDAFASYRDEFAWATLDPRWSVYKPDSATVTVSGGRVRIEPVQGGSGLTGCFWYSSSNGALGSEQNDGVFVYQTFGPGAGTPTSFDVRARIRVRDAADTGNPPADVGTWRFGGLAVHDPTRTSYLRYLHCALGTEGGAAVSGIENKVNRVNATGGASVFPVAALVGALARDVRIVRRATDANIFDMYDAASTGALSRSTGWGSPRYTVVWDDGERVADTFPACPQETDAGLATTVQVGLICYSNNVDNDNLLDCLEFWAGETTD